MGRNDALAAGCAELPRLEHYAAHDGLAVFDAKLRRGGDEPEVCIWFLFLFFACYVMSPTLIQ